METGAGMAKKNGTINTPVMLVGAGIVAMTLVSFESNYTIDQSEKWDDILPKTRLPS